jgi:hypothetical protein
VTPSPLWGPEARVLVRPAIVYEALARTAGSGTSWARALQRPAFIALLLGAVFTLTTAGQLTLRLLVGAAVAWSFVPLVQIAAVAALVTVFRVRHLSPKTAVDLYFVGHAPWSLWLLGVAGIATFAAPSAASDLWGARPGMVLTLSLLLPLLWSKRLTWAFLRQGLALEARRAAGALALHDALTWGAVVFYFLVTDQLWPRLRWPWWLLPA